MQLHNHSIGMCRSLLAVKKVISLVKLAHNATAQISFIFASKILNTPSLNVKSLQEQMQIRMNHQALTQSSVTLGVSTSSVPSTLTELLSCFCFLEFHRKRQPMVISQMILSPPAMMKGQEKIGESTGLSKKQPFRPKPKTRPIDLAILVMPLAADRSSLETTMETQVCLAGTSICEMQKRPKRSAMLMVGLLVKAMKRRKTLEGKWVQIMVAMAPILSTSLEERTPLIPLTMLQAKRTPPIASKRRSYLDSQQQERQLWTMKAPAKASTANSILRVTIVLMFSFLMPVQVMSCLSLTSCASISFLSMQQQQMNMNPPSSAQMRTIFVVASIYEKSKYFDVSSTKKPANMAPSACEIYPAIPQYPNTAEVYFGTSSRWSTQSSTNCERADCSMGMKGPISPPLTDMTPKIPLMVRMMMLFESAQNKPVSSLRKEPIMRVLTRPMRSARVVRQSDRMMSPKTMADCSHEDYLASRPLKKRLLKKTTASMPQENMRRMRVRKSILKSLAFC